MDALLQDFRFALRHLCRAPGVSAATILTLSLGIGATAAAFTMLNTLLIRRLPVADPDGLIGMICILPPQCR